RAAARALGRFGERRAAVDHLLRALEEEEDARVRAALYDAIARRGDAIAAPVLARSLPGLSLADRRQCLRTLGALGGDDATRVLVEWLGAADVGDDAAEALVRIGAPAVPSLIRALRVPPAAARAASCLGRIGDARAAVELAAVLDGSSTPAKEAILRALGALADERVAHLVHPYVDAAAAPVRLAAVESLAHLATSGSAAVLEEALVRGTPDLRPAALVSLAAVDPPRAAPWIERWLAAESPPARRAARRAAFERPAPAFLAALGSLAQAEVSRAAATEALSRIPGGGGLSVLLDLPADPARDVALALAIRRHPGTTDLQRRALAVLEATPGTRRLWLLGLAGEARMATELADRLRAEPDAAELHRLAVAAALLGPEARPAVGRLLVERMVATDDAATFRHLAHAVDAVRQPVDPAPLQRYWYAPSTAAEALWLAAGGLDASSRTEERLRRVLRRALRSPSPRTRAGAALALARAGDRGAWRALIATLEDEDERVRRAAARALAALDVPEARSAAAAHLRVEERQAVRDALEDAVRPGPRRPPPAAVAGDGVLYARVRTPGNVPLEAVVVDVHLPDGRWWRTRTLGQGEVLIAGLPAGEAEVVVRLDR
ncbi:MAG: HEAT repeat domain-containing protein, partial [Sandaracinaceae bacterium]